MSSFGNYKGDSVLNCRKGTGGLYAGTENAKTCAKQNTIK
jgi:hypothetical protein